MSTGLIIPKWFLSVIAAFMALVTLILTIALPFFGTVAVGTFVWVWKSHERDTREELVVRELAKDFKMHSELLTRVHENQIKGEKYIEAITKLQTEMESLDKSNAALWATVRANGNGKEAEPRRSKNGRQH